MQYAVVMSDYHSKWPEVMYTESASTSIVLQFMMEVFSKEGFPQTVVSDNGVQFVSNEMTKFLYLHHIKHVRTALYDPQCNGQVERFNR
mgnify:CR=1 FL=1